MANSLVLDESPGTLLPFALELQDQQRTMIGILTDPEPMIVELETTSNAHGASGRYIWSTLENAGMVTLQNLPPLPFGESYAVWVEDEQSRQMLTQTFEPDSFGSAREVLRGAADAEPVRVYVAARESDGTTDLVILQGIVGR